MISLCFLCESVEKYLSALLSRTVYEVATEIINNFVSWMQTWKQQKERIGNVCEEILLTRVIKSTNSTRDTIIVQSHRIKLLQLPTWKSINLWLKSNKHVKNVNFWVFLVTNAIYKSQIEFFIFSGININFKQYLYVKQVQIQRKTAENSKNSFNLRLDLINISKTTFWHLFLCLAPPTLH